MRSAKVFVSGNSRAIRLPKEFGIEDDELYMQKIGNAILLLPKSAPWELFEKSLNEFSDDFMADGRDQPTPQTRDSL